MAVNYYRNDSFQGSFATLTLALAGFSVNLTGLGKNELILDTETYTETCDVGKSNGSVNDYVHIKGKFGTYNNTIIDGINHRSQTQYTRFSDLTFRLTSTQTYLFTQNASNNSFYRVRFDGLTYGAIGYYNQYSNCKLYSCLLQSNSSCTVMVGAATTEFYNCTGVTVVGVNSPTFNFQGLSAKAVNCYGHVIGTITFPVFYQSPNLWTNSSNNASSDNSARGTSPTINVTNNFYGSGDYRIKSTINANVINGGTDLTGTNDYAIDGTPFVVGSWPIGCYNYFDVNTYLVGSDKPYVTVNQAINHIPSSLTGTKQHKLILDSGTYSESININKTNPSSTDFVEITSTDMKGMNWDSSHAIFQDNVHTRPIITVNTAYTKINKIELYDNSTNATPSTSAVVYVNSPTCTISRCLLFIQSNRAGIFSNQPILVYSTVVASTNSYSGIYAFHNNGSSNFELYNCVGYTYGHAIYNQSGTMNVKNTYANSSSGSAFYNVSGTLNQSNNASDDNTASGTGSLINIGTSQFVSPISDFRIRNNSVLFSVGTNLLSFGVTEDLEGRSFIFWSIGAFDYLSSIVKYTTNKTVGTTPLIVRFTDTTDAVNSSYLRTWDFGDGITSASYLPYIDHIYSMYNSSNGFIGDAYYTPSLMLDQDNIFTSANAIHVIGPRENYEIVYKNINENFPYTISASDINQRNINLTKWLPIFLQETELETLVKFFENYLNSMYKQRINNIQNITDFEDGNDLSISILKRIEKIKDFHNIDKIDSEYLQLVANYLGYNVDLNLGQLGILTEDNVNDPIIQEDVRKYLRFIVSALPEWYKIKTNEECVKILLFSFGLVGKTISKWTKNYREFITYKEGYDDQDIIKDAYQTSHFTVLIDIDQSVENLSTDSGSNIAVKNAIDSVRPINTVFDGLTGWQERYDSVQYFPYVLNNLYQRIDS